MNILNEILRLSKEFISIKSISENSKALDEILGVALLNLEGFTIERFNNNGIQSALVYNTNKRPKKFNVILNGHLDVIPGKEYQYKPKVIGSNLYGIGSMDMKANVACFIMAFKAVARKVDYPFALQLVTDEQVGGLNGTKYQIDQGVRADFVIVGETTNFNIVHRAKGVQWIKISAKGKSSHSAYPWKGKNAIWELNAFLNKLKKKYPIPHNEIWKTTVSVSNIETSNNSFNKIPDDCTVWLDIRYVAEEKDSVINRLENLISNNFTLDIVFDQPPLFVNKDNGYLKVLQNTTEEIIKHKVLLYGAHGTSDVTYYAKVGSPGIEFGPIGVTGNTNNEYINIPSLEMYYLVLVKFLLSLNNMTKTFIVKG